MKHEPITGSEFEQTRPKLKKDKNFFAKLDNKERDEDELEIVPAVKQFVKKEKEPDVAVLLPFGNQKVSK